ncbi:MAG: tRNA pseudouridine(55) synthase TruB [Candidatus Caldatribacterium sp.]|uniref:tRNA pseudouridine(55) synthase TruB n=1 Tax=Candidatus Caldatribacterium sp. TaxID=2282143 RepID=UPI0029973351|nr:tRNA pseudouridine(55) synthase TruB [Candidatus Caldatribacterium sp.]MCX7730108.1 tRNA pseudouridine(55) synthase TruB [Candidatus Caldatribacterium sp.]MDW8080872.1 tRNA pseudouridine(55) synthase TruB [Candidatus Calescibacterium sp.]
MLGGVLNLYKPVGMTSRALVERVGKILGTKVGHTGTLDPFARGVVLVCFGRTTRLVSFFQELDKVYRARIRFGIATDTYDVKGSIVAVSTQSLIKQKFLEALQSFRGTFVQEVPPFSACKYRGRPLYEYARRGERITLTREVTVHHLEVLDCTEGVFGEVELRVHCSGGTYVRSLAYDLGKKLGLGAYVFSLVRERVGIFPIEESIDVMRRDINRQFLLEQAIPPDKALYFLKSVEVGEEEARFFLHGTPFTLPVDLPGPSMVKVLHGGSFLGLAFWDTLKFLPRIVLAESCHVS